MKMKTYLTFITEKLSSKTFYHGTRSKIPFEKFDSSMIGTGLVSTSKTKYGGFFFTSSFDNANFYTEYFITEVKIDNVESNPLNSKWSPDVMNKAINDNKIYLIEDILDGGAYSDIVVVPSILIENIKIDKWIFVGDEESYFEELDKLFGSDEDEDDYIDKNIIEDVLETIEVDINYLLKIPIWKKYYDSK